MTPAELRALPDEATPAPWRVEGRFVRSEQRLDPLVRLDRYTNHLADADARLIALAPDLALLCAEMGEALEDSIALVRSLRPDLSYTRTRADRVVASNRAALAKLEALEARA